MSQPRIKTTPARAPRNQRRTRKSFAEMMGGANQRAHEVANLPSGRRAQKSRQAVIAATSAEVELAAEPLDPGFWRKLPRNLLGLPLLPFCWVTLWTLLWQFSRATFHQGFWQTTEFWFFATGVVVMIGWLASGLREKFFLYSYVLGHEVTHAVFVFLCGGRVTDIGVSSTGGYVTTTKTNLLIALSPYFVPFWSVVTVAVYIILKLTLVFSAEWDKAFYFALGFTWTFHMVMTVWMIPKDQPDLRENGTLLSLAVIFFTNLVMLTVLLCVSGRGGILANFEAFGREWLRYAIQLAEVTLRLIEQVFERAAMNWPI
ncbi:MAG: hypothetical protein K9N23_12400 [Akkermansiaceae bacterium]|nr:hypothetical protein [Akkermansiaceae bacterium]MCF7732484.1 hypothetical protein [Akkermansiaceae bacterium]